MPRRYLRGYSLTLPIALLHCVVNDHVVHDDRYVVWQDGVALMLIVGQERSPPKRISVGRLLNALAFSSNGEHFVSGGTEGVRVWRVEDGEQVAAMAAPYVRCIAVSKDGRCIAAGTHFGEVIVWDAETYEKIFALEDIGDIYGVDFSPDSTRLVTASADKVSIWGIATRGRTTLHDDGVLAAKFSPQGDQIAIATRNSVRIYDSNDRRLLVEIPVKVTGWINTGLLWSKAHLFVVSDSKIKQIDPSTGSVVSQWLVPGGNDLGRIALPTHGEFIAHSTNRTVTFWDASAHTQLGLIQHAEDICSIALSPDDRFLAIGGESGKITIKRLSQVTVSSVVPCWTVAYLNNARGQTFKSTALCLICGSTINSRTRKRC